MLIAKEELGIPMIISAEDLSNPSLDEKSALTYLSYFMKEHGPGYDLIIDWLQRLLPTRTISNLTVSCLLVKATFHLRTIVRISQ